MGALEINGQTLATESGGTLTSPQLNITQGTLGTAAANVTIVRGELQSDVNINAPLASATLASTTTFPAGHVIQVIYSQKTDREALSTSGWTDIPGTDQDGLGSIFSAKIVPSSLSSKILVTVNLEGSGGSGNYVFGVRLYRGTDAIGLSDQIGSSRPRTFMTTGEQVWSNYGRNNLTNDFLDSPNSLLEQTYSLKVWDSRDNGTVYINRAYYDTDGGAVPTGTSSIKLMEISG